MKSIKKQLLITILGVVFGFSILIFFITLSQLVHQKNTIKEQGQKEAQVLSKETGETLGRLNEQVARDFAGSCSRYFNHKFAAITKHVNAIQENMDSLYQGGKSYGSLDKNVGLAEGVAAADVSKEFSVISPIRDFIKYLPEYDKEKLDKLDLYVMTDSGMCLDGAGSPMGEGYPDLRKEDWYQQAKEIKKTGRAYWSGIFKGKVTGKTKVICAMPIRDRKGRLKGCAAGDMDVGAFQGMIEEFDEKQIVSVIFFDRGKEMMYATNGYENTDRIKAYLGKEEVVSQGDEVYAFSTLEETGWTICLVLNQEMISQTMKKLQVDVEKNAEGITGIVQESIERTIVIFGISMAVGIVLAVIITNFLAGVFVRPIRQLMSQVREAGSGNLNQQISVKSKNEIGQLANAFHNMTEELKKYMDNLQNMTASQERVAAELNVARQIQMNMLPQQFPAFSGKSEFDIYAVVNPVAAGGGSFYDYFMVDKTHLCMVIGEVTGTGIPSTLFAVITKTHIKNYAQLGYEPDRILAETNNQLSYKNEAGLTVSVFVGIVDLQTGVYWYSNAGQMSQLWKHSGKDFEFLSVKSGFALANMENVPYRKQSVHFAQGDMILLYTQGVSGTMDAKGNEYTREYLHEYLNLVLKQQYEMKDIADSILDDLKRFSAGMEQSRDSTLLLFRYFGK